MFVVCVLVCAYLVYHSWEFGVGGFYLGLCAFGGVEVEEGEGEVGLGHDEAVAGVEWESCLAECLLEDASGVTHLVAAGAGKPYVARGTFPFCVEYKLFDERGGCPRVDGEDEAEGFVAVQPVSSESLSGQFGYEEQLLAESVGELLCYVAAVAATGVLEFHIMGRSTFCPSSATLRKMPFSMMKHSPLISS